MNLVNLLAPPQHPPAARIRIVHERPAPDLVRHLVVDAVPAAVLPRIQDADLLDVGRRGLAQVVLLLKLPAEKLKPWGL
ncbi:hypothetical protein PG995_002542 [Apiospora arundinis]|uniref:Uncharacterized protein n=1 Tax=Apiospora arundinis TaxID=335852 RepID=A0ABR2J4Z4_9PEZI